MNILINATNLKKGGGIQVADSICRELGKYSQHRFVVVISSFLLGTKKYLDGLSNVVTYVYNLPNGINVVLSGRDSFLDKLVDEETVGAVLTIFGPSLWRPKCPHLCGFARAQLVIPESPYYANMGRFQMIRQQLQYGLKELAFKMCSKNFYSENPHISKRLEHKWQGKRVYTVTNYYNQVFDHPEQWKEKKLSCYDGVTFLTVTAAYPHKNLPIALKVARVLKEKYPDFNFRFVITITSEEFEADVSGMEEHFNFIGRVDISECPSLYQQCNLVFQPTLLECFTASYPEAMRMEKPIVTTDMEFARGLCKDAACYYRPVDAEAAADAIYKVATNKEYAHQLVENGKKQLLSFDNYEKRAEKLIKILEKISD